MSKLRERLEAVTNKASNETLLGIGLVASGTALLAGGLALDLCTSSEFVVSTAQAVGVGAVVTGATVPFVARAVK